MVGSICILCRPCLENPIHSVGVCYEVYPNGLSFIFENGLFDGFSTEEMSDFLCIVDFSPYLVNYEFKSVTYLMSDFRAERFKHTLEPPPVLRNQYIQAMREIKIDSLLS